MIFCPKCGSLLVPKKIGNKKSLSCSCGYTSEETTIAKINEKVNIKEQKVEVVDSSIETLPTVKENCPKCDHPEALFWTEQTRSADESETRFFKCKKCSHVWREYA